VHPEGAHGPWIPIWDGPVQLTLLKVLAQHMCFKLFAVLLFFVSAMTEPQSSPPEALVPLADSTSTAHALVASPGVASTEADAEDKKIPDLSPELLDKWLDDYVAAQMLDDAGSTKNVFEIGYYASLTRDNSVNPFDLLRIFNWLFVFLVVNPLGKGKRTQIKEAILRCLDRHKSKTLNRTQFTNQVYSDFLSKRFMVIMFHLRRLKRDPEHRETTLNKLIKRDDTTRMWRLLDGLKFYKLVPNTHVLQDRATFPSKCFGTCALAHVPEKNQSALAHASSSYGVSIWPCVFSSAPYLSLFLCKTCRFL